MNDSQLNKKLKQELQLILHDIVGTIANYKRKQDIPSSLLSGSMGISLFLFYYARYTQKESYENSAIDYLESAINNIGANFDSSFCNGASGICWGINHLIENKFINCSNIDIIETFDNFIYNDVLQKISINYFDYLHGIEGAAIYLLKRIKEEKILKLEDKIINKLYQTKNGSKNECFWEYKFGNKKNLSISHGQASTCIYLTKAYQAGINKIITKELLQKSVAFLLSQEVKELNKISIFPTFSLNEPSSIGSRLGWCYGDLGIGMALWHYANALGDEKMKQKAIDIFLFSTLRKDPHKNGVIDSCVCHGSAGIALIFRKMYLYTQRNEFLEAAYYWLQQTLLISKYENGSNGSNVINTNTKAMSLNLLNGISGTGLVLLSFLTNNDTTWDEFLLLS